MPQRKSSHPSCIFKALKKSRKPDWQRITRSKAFNLRSHGQGQVTALIRHQFLIKTISGRRFSGYHFTSLPEPRRAAAGDNGALSWRTRESSYSKYTAIFIILIVLFHQNSNIRNNTKMLVTCSFRKFLRLSTSQLTHLGVKITTSATLIETNILVLEADPKLPRDWPKQVTRPDKLLIS